MCVFVSSALWGLLGLLVGVGWECVLPPPPSGLVPGQVGGEPQEHRVCWMGNTGTDNLILRHVTSVWVITFWLLSCLLEAS